MPGWAAARQKRPGADRCLTAHGLASGAQVASTSFPDSRTPPSSRRTIRPAPTSTASATRSGAATSCARASTPDTREARADDPRRRDQALASGAQWVSTDYPAPGIAARYRVRMPNHRPTVQPGQRAPGLPRDASGPRKMTPGAANGLAGTSAFCMTRILAVPSTHRKGVIIGAPLDLQPRRSRDREVQRRPTIAARLAGTLAHPCPSGQVTRQGRRGEGPSTRAHPA
jgi:hypothetical protein